jgi:hypothetical protein
MKPEFGDAAGMVCCDSNVAGRAILKPNDCPDGRFGWIVLPLAIAGVLLMLLLTAGGCSRRNQPEVDPLAPYRAGVKDAFQSDIDLVHSAPRYAIDVTVDPSYELLTGTATISIVNTSPDPWRHLVFRLYPMLEHYGGEMTLLSALVNDGPSSFIYQADNTALRVNLPAPLPTGEEAVVGLSWKLTIPKWSDSSTVYALFGNSQGMTSLPLFYPSLAVYEPGPAIGTGHWWLDTGSVRGDAAFNEASLFTVTATLPQEQIPVATGTLVATDTVGQDQIRYSWVTGPVREFLLHMSPQFESASMDAYGTTITSYWLPGDEEAGRAALGYAVGALRFYSDYFGGYPFRDMQIAPAALSYRGMEYPQVNLLGVELYSKHRKDLETLTVHEIAHQWWYQIVHNDPVRMPWLDEALAEFSMGMYFEALYGQRAADLVAHQRWQIPLDLLSERGGNVGMNRAVDDFESGSQYETIVYAKGALLYQRLRNILGDRAFRAFLRQYLADHRYGIVDTDDWLAAIRALDRREAEELYRRWVDAPLPQEMPNPVLEEELAEESAQ